jgi:putative endonuclease
MSLSRIEAAADHWLARQPDYHKLSLRFDLIAVLPRRWPVHIPAAVSFRN